uniref:Transmembrane protein n=1 Tax=Dulem virus 40 TaxID=3145758 RepID=A0AAU8AW64_9CAUD
MCNGLTCIRPKGIVQAYTQYVYVRRRVKTLIAKKYCRLADKDGKRFILKFYYLFSYIYMFLPYISAIKLLMSNISVSYTMADGLVLLQLKFVFLHWFICFP